MSEVLTTWDIESLCEAVLKLRGASHTEKAAPRRKKKTKKGNTESVPAFDLFDGTFDVVALMPAHMISAQAYSGMSEGTLSDKQVHVSENGPWPPYVKPQTWHWKRQDKVFDVATLIDNHHWEDEEQIPVPDPRRILNRADTSLDTT